MNKNKIEKQNELSIEEISKALTWYYKHKLKVLTVLDIVYSLTTDMFSIMYVVQGDKTIKNDYDILRKKSVNKIIKEYKINLKKEGNKYE